MNEVDFHGGWDSFWGAVESAIGPQAVQLMTIVGLAMVVYAIAKWVWDRRKGGGGGGGGLIWWLVIGAILAAPAALMPLFLLIADWIINAGIKIFNSAG